MAGKQIPHLTVYEIAAIDRRDRSKRYRVMTVVNTTEYSVGDVVGEEHLRLKCETGRLRFTVKPMPKNRDVFLRTRTHSCR